MWKLALVILGMICASSTVFADFTEHTTKRLGRKRTGPPDYHNVYSRISKVMVTIQHFDVRTKEGYAIRVNTAPTQINLMDLVGFNNGKGIRLNLKNVNFPGRAATIDAVEIVVGVKGCKNDAVFWQGNQAGCNLCTCNSINLYVNQPVTLGKEEYYIKVPFIPLNSIQLDIVQTTYQDYECRNIFGTPQPCEAKGRPKTKVTYECSLANRRHLIGDIVPATNEF